MTTRPRTLAPLLATLFLSPLAGVSAAQSSPSPIAASPGHILLRGELSGTGGAIAGPSLQMSAELGAVTAAQTAASPGYVLRGGTVTAGANLAPGKPYLIAAGDGFGPAAGGQVASLIGVRFDTLGTTSVAVHGAPASVWAVTHTGAEISIPSGTDELGNPLGVGPVRVTTAAGSHAADGAWSYTPALDLAAPAHVGGELALALRVDPGALVFLALGQGVPGMGLPIPPFEGALVPLMFLQSLGGPYPATDGELEVSFQLPSSAGLAGASFLVQGLSFTPGPTASGGFTNATAVVVAP